MPTFTESLRKMQRFGRFLRLFDGKPDALPPIKPIFTFDGSTAAFSASVHTDREWGGRSRATFRVGNAGASGSGVCGVFEGFIDKSPSMVPNEAGVTGRHGFAMLQLRTHEDEVGCEEYDALALRASGDGRLYSVSLRNAMVLLYREMHFLRNFGLLNTTACEKLIKKFVKTATIQEGAAGGTGSPRASPRPGRTRLGEHCDPRGRRGGRLARARTQAAA